MSDDETTDERMRRVIGEVFADFDIGGWWKCVPGPERRQLADALILALRPLPAAPPSAGETNHADA